MTSPIPQPPRLAESGSTAEMLRGLATLATILSTYGFPTDISKAIEIGEALEEEGFCIRRQIA